jgi:lysophospholipase L1-like esterase
MKKSLFLLLAILSAVVSYAQPQDRRAMDWAAFNRYAEANAELTESPLVVFMGDSITDFWVNIRPGFFTSHNYVGRGISGQTVEHMLARFQQDVVDLHPRAVVIMAGVNNIAGNNGKIDFEDIAACIKSMCDIAKANNIIPILCSLTPCHRFFWNPEAEPAQDVIRLNGIYEAYAREAGIEYVDYHKAMALPGGVISETDSNDGCHPTAAGYEKMEAVVEPVIERVLAAAARPARPAGPARQMGPQDWPNFKRYEEKNAALTQAPLMVLMGDSITDFWYDNDPDFFEKNNFAGRGISGQTASQMLTRFKQDVINLRPKAVAIMCGTNDLCQNMASQAYYPDQTIFDNTVAMCELAEDAGIKVLLCSITPCAHYMILPDIDAGSVIEAFNARLKAYADTHKNVTYVDYFTPLATAEKGLAENGSYDGIHPAVNLYDDMERILVDGLKKALKLKKQSFYTLPSDEADRRKAAADVERREKNQPMNFNDMVEMLSRMRMGR